MKRRILLSSAFAFSVLLLSLLRSDSTHAQRAERFVADTGVVALGADQVLRVTSDWNGDGPDTVGVRFRRMEYTQGLCNGPVCQLAVSSQNTSDPIGLMPGEALSLTVDPTNAGVIYVRAVVASSSKNVQVTAEIIDIITGKVVSHIIVANTDGDNPW